MRRVILAMCVLLWAAPLFAAGSVTVTEVPIQTSDRRFDQYIQYTIAWTSSAGGAVSGNAFTVKPGKLYSVRFIPGTPTPSDLYDVTITDSVLADFLSGQGANLSASAASQLLWSPGIFQSGVATLDIVVANAGNAKSGTVVLIVELDR